MRLVRTPINDGHDLDIERTFAVEPVNYSMLVEFETMCSFIQRRMNQREHVLVCGNDHNVLLAFAMAYRKMLFPLLELRTWAGAMDCSLVMKLFGCGRDKALKSILDGRMRHHAGNIDHSLKSRLEKWGNC